MRRSAEGRFRRWRTFSRSRLSGSVACFFAVLLFFGWTARAGAFHWFRGAEDGMDPNCTPASGEVSDDPTDSSGNPIHGPITAEVALLHNTFNDQANGTPVTHIKAGEAVRWVWSSAHCHSVDGRSNAPSFYSEFHYPAEAPVGQQKAVPGFFDYPIPDFNPKLNYVHTFPTPGTYTYSCEHHFEIGMQGVVIVDAAP